MKNFCDNCGKRLEKTDQYCGTCGTEANLAPASSTTKTGQSIQVDFPIFQTWRLLLFGFLSFGFYSVLWFTRYFQAIEEQRTDRGRSTSPLLYGVFNLLTSNIVFQEIARLEKKDTQITQKPITPVWWAVQYAALRIVASVLFMTPLVLVLFASRTQARVKKLVRAGLVKTHIEPIGWPDVIITMVGLLLAIFTLQTQLSELNFNTTRPPSEAQQNNLLLELDPGIEALGYFSEPALFESNRIDTNEWLTYVKYQSNPDLAQGSGVTDSLMDVYSAVVKIVCEDADYYYYGSGTNIDSAGYVVTNLHVIEANPNLACIVGFPNPQDGTIREAYWATPVIDMNNETGHDLALLSVEEPVFDAELNVYGFYERLIEGRFPYYEESDECLETSGALGANVFVLGYPSLSGRALTVTDGLISSLYSADGYLITSAKIGAGNSGGLAIDENYCFIGVPTAVYSDPQDESYGEIIDAYFVYEYLEAVLDDVDYYLENQ